MSLLESVKVALNGLFANKMRSVLTMLGVIIGVAAVISMLAISSGARDAVMKEIEAMGTNLIIIRSGQARKGSVMGGFGSKQSLVYDDAVAIAEECPSVSKVAPEITFNLQVKYKNTNTKTTIVGTSSDYMDVRNFTVRDGDFFSRSDEKARRRVAVLGSKVVENLFGETRAVGKYISIKGIRFEVVGILEEKGSSGGPFGDQDDQILIPVTTAMKRVFGVDYLTIISIQTDSQEMMDNATVELTALLRKRHNISGDKDDDFILRTQKDLINMADNVAGIFTILLAGVAGVSLVVGGIGIMNIMLVSVTERTREIGLRIAIGARRKDIRTQFLVEALVLSLFGGLIGIMIGMTGSSAVLLFTEWNASVSAASVLISFGFAAFVGIFFGYYPARKASLLNPIEALRYE